MVSHSGVQITVPWPRYPTTTSRGEPSRAKTAGHLIPWLSLNVVNNLPRPLYHRLAAMWREAAEAAVTHDSLTASWDGPTIAYIYLYKATAQPMDPWAVLEGAKPLIDGLILAGVLPDDDRIHRGDGAWCKAGYRADCRVVIGLYPIPVLRFERQEHSEMGSAPISALGVDPQRPSIPDEDDATADPMPITRPQPKGQAPVATQAPARR